MEWVDGVLGGWRGWVDGVLGEWRGWVSVYSTLNCFHSVSTICNQVLFYFFSQYQTCDIFTALAAGGDGLPSSSLHQAPFPG